jgi:hypothetical protein
MTVFMSLPFAGDEQVYVMRVSKCSEEIFNVRRKNYFLRTFHGVSM